MYRQPNMIVGNCSLRHVLLLRHSEALPSVSFSQDHKRLLSAAGEEKVSRLAPLIKTLDFKPQFGLVSHAERAKKTAELLEHYGVFPKGTFQPEPRLYMAEDDELADILTEYGTHFPKSESLGCVLVGHNNGLSDLCSYLSGKMESLDTAEGLLFSWVHPTLAPSWEGGHWEVKARFERYFP